MFADNADVYRHAGAAVLARIAREGDVVDPNTALYRIVEEASRSTPGAANDQQQRDDPRQRRRLGGCADLPTLSEI
jgi:hypothetical protein